MSASASLSHRVKALTVSNPLVEHFKTALFVYVLLTRLLKVHRHLRARGLRSTALEYWTWLNKVCMNTSYPLRAVYSRCPQQLLLFALRVLPAQRKKAESEIAAAKKIIETSLIPKGEAVVRHTSLPPQGQSPAWILDEMTKMDNEIGHAEWKNGKISGAVYRVYYVFVRYCTGSLTTSKLHRRRRRPHKSHR